MPTYEYKCRDCGHEFDVVQSFTDDALSVCPNCKGALRKVFSPVGIVLKGSGFYKTDSRSSNGKSSSSSSSESSKSESTTSDSKSETKTDSKKDSGSSSESKSSSSDKKTATKK